MAAKLSIQHRVASEWYAAGVRDERARWQDIMVRLLELIGPALAVILLSFTPALAAPFLECDPYPTSANQPTHFAVVMDGGASVDVPATPTTGGAVKLRHDLGGVANGPHTVSVKAVRIDPVWGRLESASTPFAFTRPDSASAATGLKLVP